MDAHAAAGLDAKIAELVKIRISQLNGCAFCLRMHTREAIEFGESVDRIAVIAAWWESQYFSEPERAALALAEDVIPDLAHLVSPAGLVDRVEPGLGVVG